MTFVRDIISKEPEARALYRAGKSLEYIKSKTGVSKTTLIAWNRKFDWGEKGADRPNLEQKEAQALEREAERNGLTKAKVLLKVNALLDAISMVKVGDEMVKAPDNRTQLGAASLAADVLGMKKQVESPDLAQSILSWVRSQS